MGEEQRSTRLVIVGAGTGVGKTHLGVALARALSRGGELVAALKPIESGLGEGTLSDAAQLAGASTFHVKHPPPYRFSQPVSPHLAARQEGVAIDVQEACAWVDEATCRWALVETAGGLLSPLGPGLTNLDFARALRPRAVLLVALDRLGVLHEVAACRLALRVLAPELQDVTVVLQAPAVADLSTGTNAAELLSLGTVATVFEIPRGEPSSPEVAAAVSALAEHCRKLS